MTAAQGIDAFLRILTLRRIPHVIVSTAELRLRAFRLAPVPVATSTEGVAAPLASAHRRPELATPYIAPNNEMETHIAALWQQMLGISPIGIEDDFFELGGDSLMAVQLIFQLSTAFDVELSTQMLFEASTVARLAVTVRRVKERQGAEAAKVAEVMALVEGMSDDEVRRLLAEDSPGSAAGH
jgi:acyl carrier protein